VVAPCYALHPELTVRALLELLADCKLLKRLIKSFRISDHGILLTREALVIVDPAVQAVLPLAVGAVQLGVAFLEDEGELAVWCWTPGDILLSLDSNIERESRILAVRVLRDELSQVPVGDLFAALWVWTVDRELRVGDERLDIAREALFVEDVLTELEREHGRLLVILSEADFAAELCHVFLVFLLAALLLLDELF